MIKILKQLIVKYSIESTEKAFIKFFVATNGISVKNNELINLILNDSDKEVEKIFNILSEQFKKIDIYELVKIFELLIPTDDKKINGAFFTPNNVTKFITKEVIKKSTDTICDPSCGCGAFLIEAAEYMHKNFSKSIVQTIEQNLFGVDILEYSVRRCKVLLSLLALTYKEDVSKIKFNIFQSDSLSINWENEFKIHRFDVIIGNPPYVKFQDLPKNLRASLNKSWVSLNTGNFNLYFAFFELGIKLLKETGRLGYITPNNYFTSLSAIKLRSFLADQKLISKIVDFNHLKLFEAQTYTCITFLSKDKKEAFLFERIHDIELLNKLGGIKYSKIPFSYLRNKKWRLLRESDQENIKIIERTGTKLGELFDIRVGIATCKDSVYFVDGETFKNGYFYKTYKGKEFPIEKDVVRQVIKISDFSDQEELDGNKRFIIFPYTKINDKFEVIPEQELKTKFPKCNNYFIHAREELGTRDKGQVLYPAWYAYARTQGLNFTGLKLVTPTFSDKPRFLLEKKTETLFCNGYAIYSRKESDLFNNGNFTLDILAKVLNSSIMDYYIKLTSVSIEGGYACYQKNFIELFGIPNFTKSDFEFIKKESEQKKVDKFLMQKYKINV